MSKRVLIIDGDGEVLELAETILSNVGYTVRATADTQLGLSWWREEEPDLVLFNPLTHVRDGHTLHEIVQADPMLRRSKLGFLVDAGDFANAKATLRIPAALMLSKPFEFQELITRVEQLVGAAFDD